MMRVLVVDDDFMVARVHSGYVARIPGCEVVGVAHTGADAVRLAGEMRPDLVLLDVYLPDRSGLEVRAQAPHQQREAQRDHDAAAGHPAAGTARRRGERRRTPDGERAPRPAPLPPARARP